LNPQAEALVYETSVYNRFHHRSVFSIILWFVS